MKDIIGRLVSDMRWRFSGAGRKYKPKNQEVDSWGGWKVPGFAWFAAWIGLIALVATVPDMLGPRIEDFLIPIMVITGGGGLIALQRMLPRWLNIRAYKGLLEKNERFTLVEYYKYLKRQIDRARRDPSLGGPAEINRLSELASRLAKILADKDANQSVVPGSVLGDELAAAEGLIESYDMMSRDELEFLDERLPEEIRRRVDELEEEEFRHSRTQPEAE